MIVVNFFAEPSAGKSTTAAGLFFLMKQEGRSVELITEFAKDLVWENRKDTLDDQLYVTAKQNHKLERLRGKVDYVITDSPLLLGLVYQRKSRFSSFASLVREVFNSYVNLNFFLTRAKHRPYVRVGRHQTEEQAQEVAEDIRNMLSVSNVPYSVLEANAEAPALVLYQLNKLQTELTTIDG